MLPHDHVPIWINRRRRRELRGLRSLLERYFASVRYEAFPFRVVESEESVSLRRSVEAMLPRSIEVIRATARVPLMRLVSAGGVEGVEQVNLLAVVFDLDRYSLDRAQVFDVIDATLRVYEVDASWALLRTFNPLYWTDLTLAFVETVPFIALQRFGVEPGRAARSGPGVALRVLLRLGLLATIVIALLTAFDLRDEAVGVVRDLIESLSS